MLTCSLDEAAERAEADIESAHPLLDATQRQSRQYRNRRLHGASASIGAEGARGATRSRFHTWRAVVSALALAAMIAAVGATVVARAYNRHEAPQTCSVRSFDEHLGEPTDSHYICDQKNKCKQAPPRRLAEETEGRNATEPSMAGGEALMTPVEMATVASFHPSGGTPSAPPPLLAMPDAEGGNATEPSMADGEALIAPVEVATVASFHPSGGTPSALPPLPPLPDAPTMQDAMTTFKDGIMSSIFSGKLAPAAFSSLVRHAVVLGLLYNATVDAQQPPIVETAAAGRVLMETDLPKTPRTSGESLMGKRPISEEPLSLTDPSTWHRNPKPKTEPSCSCDATPTTRAAAEDGASDDESDEPEDVPFAEKPDNPRVLNALDILQRCSEANMKIGTHNKEQREMVTWKRLRAVDGAVDALEAGKSVSKLRTASHDWINAVREVLGMGTDSPVLRTLTVDFPVGLPGEAEGTPFYDVHKWTSSGQYLYKYKGDDRAPIVQGRLGAWRDYTSRLLSPPLVDLGWYTKDELGRMPVYPGLGVVRDKSGQRVWNQRSPAGRITQATREAEYASQSNKNGAQWRVTLRKVPDILNRLQELGRQGLHDFQLMEAIADAFELSAYDRAGVYSTYWLIGGSEAIRAETSNGGGIHLVHGTHVCLRPHLALQNIA